MNESYRRSRKKKPVVKFSKLDSKIQLGQPAYVWPTNHYSPLVSNETWVRTSPVVKYNKLKGDFYTLNTHYVPASLWYIT